MKKISVNDTSTWTIYYENKCTGCTALCCTLELHVTGYDMIRLGLLTKEEVINLTEEKAKSLLEKNIISGFNLKNRTFILSKKQNGDCIFLNSDTRLCTVYENRPNACRNFPKLGPKINYCPSEKKMEQYKLDKKN